MGEGENIHDSGKGYHHFGGHNWGGRYLITFAGFTGVGAGFVDAVEDFAHVFDLFEEGVGDVDGAFLRGGQRETIARAGIDFHNLAGEFVLLLQNQAGEVGGVFQLGDDHAFDGDSESFKNALNEIVRERAFLRSVTEEHADDGAHLGLDIDDEDFFVVPDEEGAPAVCRQNTADLYRQYIVLHEHSVLRKMEKTSPGQSGFWVLR